MGIGRREFIKLFGASIATLAIDPSNAIAIFDDQYVNRKLGVAFQKPRGWHFADIQEMGKLRDGQILDLADSGLEPQVAKEWAREIINSFDLPILTISREPISADSDHFDPGVTIFLEDLGVESGFDAQAVFNSDCSLSHQVFKDFAVTSSFKTTQVSACNAGEYTASFLYEHENIKPTPVRMRTLIVNQDPQWYTIRMYDAPALGEHMKFNYTPFVESIKMV